MESPIDPLRTAGLVGAAVVTLAVGAFAVARGFATDDTGGVPAPISVPAADSANPPASGPAGSDQSGEVVEVAIAGFEFGPAELTVPVGATVVWTNEDNVVHSVVSNDGSISSPPLDEGDTFTFTFDTPGEYGYICGFHPAMTATITVEV